MTQAPTADRSRPPDWDLLLPAGPQHRILAADIDYRWQQGLARVLVTMGVLLLLFATYQLWGTGLVEQQAQRALTRQLEAASSPGGPSPAAGANRTPTSETVAATAAEVGNTALVAWLPAAEATPILDRPADRVLDVVPAPPPAAPVATALPRPAAGDALGRLELPTIGVTKTVAEGVDRDTLRTGPGRYPSTALPGAGGNLAIAGHRTTHGAPFADLDQLAPGDHIHLSTAVGDFTYEVIGHPDGDGGLRGHSIVDPAAVAVLADYGDDRLTLTACHPKYSARQRIVVSAALIDGPGVAPDPDPVSTSTVVTATASATEADAIDVGASSVPHPSVDDAPPPSEADATPSPSPIPAAPAAEPSDLAGAELESLGWQAAAVEPTVVWAVLTLLVGFAAWVVGRFWPTRLVYPAAGPVLAVPLLVCFYHLERVLPAY